VKRETSHFHPNDKIISFYNTIHNVNEPVRNVIAPNCLQ